MEQRALRVRRPCPSHPPSPSSICASRTRPSRCVPPVSSELRRMEASSVSRSLGLEGVQHRLEGGQSLAWEGNPEGVGLPQHVRPTTRPMLIWYADLVRGRAPARRLAQGVLVAHPIPGLHVLARASAPPAAERRPVRVARPPPVDPSDAHGWDAHGVLGPIAGRHCPLVFSIAGNLAKLSLLRTSYQSTLPRARSRSVHTSWTAPSHGHAHCETYE